MALVFCFSLKIAISLTETSEAYPFILYANQDGGDSVNLDGAYFCFHE